MGITAGTSQLIVNDLKDITATFERLDRDRNTVKLQEEILSTKEYLDYLKSILVIFTNTDSIRTAIYQTEASIIIYDGVIMRRIQEAETNTDTSRKEKSHLIAGDLSKSSSVNSSPSELEDEEARKRKVEEPHEKSDIPELSNRLMRIKLETAEKENDEADPGDHDDGTEKKEERDHEDDDSRKCDESRRRKAGRTESRDTSQRRSKSRGEKSKDTRTKQRLSMLDSEDYCWSGNTAFLQHYIDKWSLLLGSSDYSPDQPMEFVLQCIPNDMRYIISNCKTLKEILTKLSYYTSDGKAYALKNILEIKNSSESQTIEDDRKLLQFFSKSLENLTKQSSTPFFEYWTALDMFRKLSSDLLRHQYQSELEELATDTTGTKYLLHNNYLITMQQITTKATAELACYMDQGLKSEKPSVRTNKIHGKGYNSRELCGVRRGLSQRSNREPPQGSAREANRRFYQEQQFNRGSRRGTNLGLQRSNTKTHHSSRNQDIRYCNLCKVNGHDNLLFCPKLPEYVPELSSPTGTKSIPEEICKVCL